MRWDRAMHHLATLTAACAEMAGRPASIFPLRVVALYAAGRVLGAPCELTVVTVALCVDLPVDEVPWLAEPSGSQHWASATRLATNPVHAYWRSASAPVWNHLLDRPVLLWDQAGGVADDALAALRDGNGERVRPAAPPAAAWQARLDAELAVSLRALRTTKARYEERRWAPGRLEPVADALWRATDGYLDVLAARSGSTG